MKKRSHRSVNPQTVSASELAQMGRCERLMRFEHLYGSRRTASQRRARERGLAEHKQFEREGFAAFSTTVCEERRWLLAWQLFVSALSRVVTGVIRWAGWRGDDKCQR